MSLGEAPPKVPVDISACTLLNARSAGLSMSPAEFDAITEFDETVNYELIKGVLVVTPMSSRQERSPNELLGNWLYLYRQQHPNGSCMVETLFEEYLNPRENRRRADRVIWVAHADTRPDPDVDTPTIVVEFVSPGKAAWQRDNIEKRDEYLEAGVLEYWVIDRFRRQLIVYSQSAGKPVEQTVNESEVYRSPLLPGFELRLAELLAAADKWSQDDRQ